MASLYFQSRILVNLHCRIVTHLGSGGEPFQEKSRVVKAAEAGLKVGDFTLF